MDKSAEAFRTISEVAAALNTPAHVLRFWESKFAQIKPVKRGGGRRYYRPYDVALLAGIRQLLHDDGLTIRGVQKILREKGVRHVAELSGPAAGSAADTPRHIADARRDARAAPPRADETAPPTPRRDLFDPRPAAAADHPAGVAEAPMILDAPTLPFGGAQSATPFGAHAAPPPAQPTRAGAAEREPAAALLRAMDAVRAQGKKPELTSVYQRLSRLRDRLTRSDTPRGW